LPFYLAIIGLFILFKFLYRSADNNLLLFLLKPTSQIVSFLTGSSYVYSADSGFYYNSLNIIIEKSCSGFNFLLISFCATAFLFIKHTDNLIFKLIAIPTSLIVAHLLTILVNSARIFASIIVQQQANIFLPSRPHLIIHEIIGVTTNLSFLIVFYYVLEKLLANKFQNAKLT